MQPQHFALRLMPFLLLMGLWGCDRTPPLNLKMSLIPVHSEIIPIQEISTPSSRPSTVHLQGKVTKQVPLLDAQVYELEDTSGKILVLTQQGMPPLGAELTIEGRLQFKSIPIEGQELGSSYVEEIRRF